jgi:hypothetical protein
VFALATILLVWLPPAILLAVAWAVSEVAIPRSDWSPSARGTLQSVIRGPATAAILGWGVYESSLQLGASVHAATFGVLAPVGLHIVATALLWVLVPARLLVAIEIVLLALAIGAAASSLRRFLPADRYLSGRFVPYGIYLLGALGVVVILLVSPGVPPLAVGTGSIVGFVAGLIVTYLIGDALNVVVGRYSEARVSNEPGLKTIDTFLRRAMLGVVALRGVAVAT